LSWNSAAGSTSVDDKQLDLVTFDFGSWGVPVWCVCGFGVVEAVLDLAAFGFNRFTSLNLMVFLDFCSLGGFRFNFSPVLNWHVHLHPYRVHTFKFNC
jgi:hypothetical protein